MGQNLYSMYVCHVYVYVSYEQTNGTVSDLNAIRFLFDGMIYFKIGSNLVDYVMSKSVQWHRDCLPIRNYLCMRLTVPLSRRIVMTFLLTTSPLFNAWK